MQTQHESDRLLRLEASLKAQQQQLELQASFDSEISQLRAAVASTATEVAVREAQCAEVSQQLDKRLQDIVAREQHVAAAQAQLDADNYSLNQQRLQLWDAQQEVAAQSLMQAQAEQGIQQQHATHMQPYTVHEQQPVMQQPAMQQQQMAPVQSAMEQQQVMHMQPAMQQQQQQQQQGMPASYYYGYNPGSNTYSY
jgi:hypothetical protein